MKTTLRLDVELSATHTRLLDQYAAALTESTGQRCDRETALRTLIAVYLPAAVADMRTPPADPAGAAENE